MMRFQCRKKGLVLPLVFGGIAVAILAVVLIYLGLLPATYYKYAFALMIVAAAMFLIGGNKIVINVKPDKVAVYFSPWVMSSFKLKDVEKVTDAGKSLHVLCNDGNEYVLPVFCLDAARKAALKEALEQYLNKIEGEEPVDSNG